MITQLRLVLRTVLMQVYTYFSFMQSHDVAMSEITVHTLTLNTTFYYHIIGVSGVAGIKSPDKSKKVFIQSLSQGSRSLRKDTILLYKVHYYSNH